MINYRTVSDLNRTIIDNLWRIPRDIDVVVGVPRSGMLVANLLSLYLNRPLTDLDGLASGRCMVAGKRVGSAPLAPPRKALIVDDSVNSGGSIAEAREKLAAWSSKGEAVFLAAYVTPEGAASVDLYLEIVPNPRFFQWNLLNHGLLRWCCVDIDGVLCRDPTEQENDDGEKYLEFLSTVPSKFTPRYKIGWLVTCRLERYRAQTERWLAANGIEFEQLIMMNCATKAERLASGSHGSFKARVYRDAGAMLFIESSRHQASEISKLSGKPVICIDTDELFSPTTSETVIASVAYTPRRAKRSALKVIKSLGRLIVRG